MTDRAVRTFVLGGVRSGKSAHGESLLDGHRQIRYLATGPLTSSDGEWMDRVRLHRERRDDRYTTIETTDLGQALRTARVNDDAGAESAREVESRDERCQFVVGDGEQEQVGTLGDLLWLEERHGGQQRLGALTARVADAGRRDDLVPGLAQRGSEDGTDASGTDDADAKARRPHFTHSPHATCDPHPRC